MKESLARIHVHEPEGVPLPGSANDNAELPSSRSAVANDNETRPVIAASPEESVETAQMLSKIRSSLGVAVEVPATEGDAEEELIAPQELPQLKPEDIQGIEELISPEKVAPPSNTESANKSSGASAARAAGGASDHEGGGDDGESESIFMEESKGGNKVFRGIGKILKYAILAPIWAFGAMFALGMKGLISATNKIFDFAKLSKGGGGGSKSSGGSGGSKPSGGGGGHH